MSKHGGFSLIELMVALLVLAVGVLGVAALQLSVYRHLQTAYNVGNAAILAGEIADRMNVNSVRVLAGDYVHSAKPGSYVTCHIDACDAMQLATYDKAQWQSHITGATGGDLKTPGFLPSGSGSVARVVGTDNFLVTLRWDDDLSGSSGTNCPPQSDADLDCHQTTVAF